MHLFDGICVLLLLLVGAAWVVGIARRIFDYDELVHAHAAWLIRKGLRPFTDFFEDHPPFLWYPLGGLVRIMGDNYALLFVYRGLTAVGHVLFLFAMAKNLSLSFARTTPPSVFSFRNFAVGACVIAAHPAIIDYLLEFRLDSWPNALLLAAVYWYRRRPQRQGHAETRQVLRTAALFAFLSTAAILCSPKLMVFLALFLVATIAVDDRRPLRIAGFFAGAVGCLALAALILLVKGLSFTSFFKLVYVYHRILNEKGGFGYGLATAVLQFPVLLAILGVSFLSCVVMLRRKLLSSPFELAVLGFMLVQLVLVSFRYKQYYGPWFLLGIAFIPYLELALRRVAPVHALVLAAAVIFSGANAITARQDLQQGDAAMAEIRYRQWAEKLIPPDGLTAAAGEMMPLFRRSAFFHATTSFAPSGHATEAIMQDLGMGAKFTEQFYRYELETKRPHFIVLEGAMTPMQRKAVDDFLAAQPPERYRRLDSFKGPVFVRQQ